jgi:DNA mismatch endonuclease (patch repair protein)
VFVDGCYRHGCPEHYVPPRRNEGYWSEKVTTNVTRDRDTDERLTNTGWAVLRHWEHENPAVCARQIADTVRKHREEPK